MQRFVLVRKLDFFHFKLDKTVLFQDAVAGVPIQNVAIPCDDGIQKTTLGNDVLLKLLFFLKLQRRNLLWNSGSILSWLSFTSVLLSGHF